MLLLLLQPAANHLPKCQTTGRYATCSQHLLQSWLDVSPCEAFALHCCPCCICQVQPQVMHLAIQDAVDLDHCLPQKVCTNYIGILHSSGQPGRTVDDAAHAALAPYRRLEVHSHAYVCICSQHSS